MANPQHGALARRDVTTDREWYRSSYYSDLKRPFGVDDAIYAQLLRPGALFAITMHRARRARPFTEEDRNLMALVFDACPWVRTEADEPALAPRVRQTLEVLLTGACDKEIAAELGLSVHTVRQYVKVLLKTFGVSSRAQLIARRRTH
jgi:DNA-binding NarL/FixJ family response regulator